MDSLFGGMQLLFQRLRALLRIQAALLQAAHRLFERLDALFGRSAGFTLLLEQFHHAQHALLKRVEVIGGKWNLCFFKSER